MLDHAEPGPAPAHRQADAAVRRLQPGRHHRVPSARSRSPATAPRSSSGSSAWAATTWRSAIRRSGSTASGSTSRTWTDSYRIEAKRWEEYDVPDGRADRHGRPPGRLGGLARLRLGPGRATSSVERSCGSGPWTPWASSRRRPIPACPRRPPPSSAACLAGVPARTSEEPWSATATRSWAARPDHARLGPGCPGSTWCARTNGVGCVMTSWPDWRSRESSCPPGWPTRRPRACLPSSACTPRSCRCWPMPSWGRRGC